LARQFVKLIMDLRMLLSFPPMRGWHLNELFGFGVATDDAPPCRALAVRRPSRDDYADHDRRSKDSGHTFGR